MNTPLLENYFTNTSLCSQFDHNHKLLHQSTYCPSRVDIYFYNIFVANMKFFIVFVDDITEVRCGQQTRNFNLFPYVEVDKQSFSLIFQKEKG